MPWTVRKRGDRYQILDKNGKVVGTAATREKAQASVRARYANAPEARRSRRKY